MDSSSDSELLRDYAERRLEPAFAELVRRYVDLVYSAALRMTADRALAQDVTQAAFLALAQNAGRLTGHPVLSGWLHQTARNIAANTVRSDLRRQAREQEAAAMNDFSSTEPDLTWEQLAEHLDEGLGELSEPDRDALLLRYFENKSAREVAQKLGISDEAAQKRANRALERLRGVLAKRGVTAGAGALAVAISAHSVSAAPAGLGAAISAAAATITAGAAVQTSATITATKILAMTTLQKTLIAVSLLAAVGAGVYGVRQNSAVRNQAQLALQQQTALEQQIEQLQRERDEATNRLAQARADLGRWESAQTPAELLRLRGQVGSLRQQLASAEGSSNAPGTGFGKMMSDPAMRDYMKQAMLELVKRRYAPFFQELKLTPDQTQQMIDLLNGEFQQGIQRLVTSQRDGSGTPPRIGGTNDYAELVTKLQALLGEDGVKRFGEYSQEIPARTTLDMLDGQLGASKLTDDQRTQLFNTIRAEPYNLTHGIAGDLDKAFFGSQEEIDSYVAKVAESNQRVVQQAGNFLNSDQVSALSAVLSNGIVARVAQGAAFTKKN